MAEEVEKKEERDDADAGTLLKTAIDRLDSLHKRLDALEDKKRDDAEEEEEHEKPEPVAADKRKRKDDDDDAKRRKDAEEKEEKEEKDDSTVFYRGNKAPTKKKDAARERDDDDDDSKRKRDDEEMMDSRKRDDDDDDSRRRKRDDDDAKKKRDDSRKRDDRARAKDDDDDDDARDDAEEEEEEKKRDDDSKRHRDDSAISKRIARVEAMLPKQLSDSDRAEFSDVQSRADSVYHAFGSRAPAPMQGESLIAYRQRLATKLKEHSPAWTKVNIYAIADDNAFKVIEDTIYNDALMVAASPATAEPGTLRMITNVSGGHEIHTFAGEPRAWMDSMAGPVRMHVTAINTPNNGSAR